VTTVLSSVGAFKIVMGTSNGKGVRVVFEIIEVTTSTGCPTTVGAKSYSTVYCVRHDGCASCLGSGLGFQADVVKGRM
jgi:hypothetical protein